jgi:hypothetical protein
MKRFLLIISILLLVSPAWGAGEVVQTNNGFADYRWNEDMKTATFTVTADGSGNVAIHTFMKPQEIYGYYLFSVEMYSATDDAFATLIYTNLGSPLFSFTTTSATTGQIENASDRWPIYSAPKIDVTGLTATEVATIIVTFVR